MGPTASGKTDVAVALKRQKLALDVISVDSAAVYKGMNIGTAKPIFSELKIAPHRLIDIRDPSECYSVSDFYYDAHSEINNIFKSGRASLLVGGTMLYFYVLLNGLFSMPKSDETVRNDLINSAKINGWISLYDKLQYIDPVAAKFIHFNDHKRIVRAIEVFLISGKTWTELKFSSYSKLIGKIYKFAVVPQTREILNKNIKSRFYNMLESGFENEVGMLFSRPELHIGKKSSISCIGYRQMWEYLLGNISYDDMVLQVISATCRMAKHQLTWLRKWSDLYYVSSNELSIVLDSIAKIVARNTCN